MSVDRGFGSPKGRARSDATRMNRLWDNPGVSADRVAVVQGRLQAWLESASPATVLLGDDEPLRPGGRLHARLARQMFADMALSRALDVAARELKKSNRSYYTISSAGHEQNVVLGEILRVSDPCFLHYRSGALMMARGRKDPAVDPAMDTLLGLCAAADDPITGGRHKVWGSRALWVPPQTSTIASHLPKAVGTALAMARARRLKIDVGLPADSIVCCSFGDASVNHATALVGIHAARYARKRGNPMPVLFVCEDNGIGISVETPVGWLRETWAGVNHMAYFPAAGHLDEVYEIAAAAVQTCRATRAPVFLHLKTERLWGHAGSDIETGYRSLEEIEQVEARDPLLAAAQRLVELGAATPSALLALVHAADTRVRMAAEDAAARPKLTSRAEVMRPLAPFDRKAVEQAAALAPDATARERLFQGSLPERAVTPQRRTMAAAINAGAEMARGATPASANVG